MKPTDVIDLIVKYALREDVGRGDITSAAVLGPARQIKADIEAKESGILCGMDIAERVFRVVDPNLRFLPVAKDGESIEKGRELAYITGNAASIMIGERTALNFMSHLSGISTLTRQYVDKIKGTRAQILDTRKTTPNLRIRVLAGQGRDAGEMRHEIERGAFADHDGGGVSGDVGELAALFHALPVLGDGQEPKIGVHDAENALGNVHAAQNAAFLRLEGRLANEEFLKKAPKEIVDKERKKGEELENRRQRLVENLRTLSQ